MGTILSSVGIDADDEKLGKVISELSGKSIDDVIAAGNAKLASVPSGGGAVAHPMGEPLLVVMLLKKPKKKRRKRNPKKKNLMMTWDSVSSIRSLLDELHPHFDGFLQLVSHRIISR